MLLQNLTIIQRWRLCRDQNIKARAYMTRDKGWDSVLDVEANIHQAINATIKAYT
jgi:hypothetical protein